MALILTIFTGVALLLLLGVLAAALGHIASSLQKIMVTMQKIAWGVRAIEKETSHLLPGVTTLNTSFEALSGGFGSVAQRLTKLG